MAGCTQKEGNGFVKTSPWFYKTMPMLFENILMLFEKGADGLKNTLSSVQKRPIMLQCTPYHRVFHTL